MGLRFDAGARTAQTEQGMHSVIFETMIIRGEGGVTLRTPEARFVEDLRAN